MKEQKLPWVAVLTLLTLCCLWGGNLAAIKIGSRGLAPVFMSALRSTIAAGCLWMWMRVRGVPIWPARALLLPSLVVGLLFGGEFVCVYVGLEYTYTARAYVFLYTQPFFTSLGAHFLLPEERLNVTRGVGLALAFTGILVLFVKDWGEVTLRTLPGDLLLLLAGAMWGATNLFIKRFLSGRAVALQVLFYQLFFSIPLLFGCSLLLEDRVWFGASGPVVISLVYQCLVVAFISYVVWFEMINRYPVSRVAAFTFFTPVFGAILSGILIMGEPLTAGVVGSLALVTAGMFLVNRPSGTPKEQGT